MNNKEYLLTLLSEEAAEVIQAVSKVLRFSEHHSPPLRSTTNIEELNIELAQLMAVIEMCQEAGINIEIDSKVKSHKKMQTAVYIGISKSLGCLQNGDAIN